MDYNLLYEMDAGSFLNWMRHEQIRCDSILRTEDGGKFHVHTALLASVSDFFRVLYFSKVTSDSEERSEVLIKNVKKDTMEYVLEFIYSQRVRPTDGVIGEVLVAADYFQIRGLVDFCCDFIAQNLSTDNCFQCYKVARVLEHLNITRPIYRFLLFYFEQLSGNTSGIVEMPYDVLLNLLRDNNLNSSEPFVWEIMVRWVCHDEEKRSCFLPTLLTCLRYSLLDDDFVDCGILQHETFKRSVSCVAISNMVEHQLQLHPENVCECLALSLELYWNRTYDFGARAPEKVHFVIRNRCWEDEAEDNGCWIYEMYDDSLDIYRQVGYKEGFNPKNNCFLDEYLLLYDAWTDQIVTFDVINNIWDVLPTIGVERVDYELVTLKDKAYVLGGYNFRPNLSLNQSVEVFDSTEGVWVQVNSMAKAHRGPAIVHQGKIYISGESMFDNDHIVMIVECYDPITDSWSVIAEPNVFRRHFALESYGHHLYLIGGYNLEKDMASVERYDPLLDAWTRLPDMPHAFHSPKTMIINDFLIVSDDDCTYEGRLNGALPPVFLDVATETWHFLGERQFSCWSKFEQEFNQSSICTLSNKEVIQQLRRKRWDVSKTQHDILRGLRRTA